MAPTGVRLTNITRLNLQRISLLTSDRALQHQSGLELLSRAMDLPLEGCKVSFGRNLVPGGKRSESAREAGQHLVGFRPSWRAFQRAERSRVECYQV